MIEIYTEPDVTTSLPFEMSLLVVIGGPILIGLIAAGLVAFSRQKTRTSDDEKTEWTVAATTSIALMLIMGFFWLPERPSFNENRAARAEYDAALAENRSATEEQFTDRYGEVTFLECEGGACNPAGDTAPYDILTGDDATEDVAFRTEDGVLDEDAYLVREDSDDDKVDYTVTLMIRDGADDAHEYRPNTDEDATDPQ
ncbi:hypothetical protein ACFP47_10585 [Nesterenkonia lacusekhoensis]|uniref:Uncharacterized protein n=1 Tax=Nesterenkonia lacusekhoensis TaxID=150832 RepID=A0ABS4T115_9MICC|nr:hypothetical protein [Nesterenkonia lacusekhoensis]MBP2318141.1 hypothetical protein [Nesterenkonia lacusekhoensis]